MSFKNWVFTLNNYTKEDIETLQQKDSEWDFIIFGKEIGEEGTPHLQGYIELKRRLTLKSIKKKIHDRMHLEPRRGSQAQAIEYCKKDGVFVELGKPVEQGARKDLDLCRRMAMESGMRGVSAIGSFQQIRVAEKFLTYNEEIRDFKPEVTWIWGESGAGKSKLARELCDSDDVYTKNDSSKWFEGYDGHEYLILDDFRDSWMTITDFLSLIDRYERRLEFKGGYRQLVAKKIVITSIKAPEEMYLHAAGEPKEQILRRIDTIIPMVKKKM